MVFLITVKIAIAISKATFGHQRPPTDDAKLYLKRENLLNYHMSYGFPKVYRGQMLLGS